MGATGPTVRAGLGMASVALALLLLIGFKAPQDGVVMGAARTSGAGASSGGSASGGSASSGGTTSSSGGKTYSGSIVNTRYGSVQVAITVQGGKVVSVTAVELPYGGRSGMISSYVAPILSGEAVAAQSASIDLVSGATYTSDAYAQSLQSALSQAGI